MILPWWPVIWTDILGCLAVLGLAGACWRAAWIWYGRRPADVFRHYLFLLTVTIVVFACSRSVGHLLKQLLFYTGHRDWWALIEPHSGAVNTASFVVVFVLSIGFQRLKRIQAAAEEAAFTVASARAEVAAVRERETALAAIFDAMADVVYIIDAQYRIRFFNRRLREWLPNLAEGDLCHDALMGGEEPCPGCKLHGTIDRAAKQQYERFLPGLGRLFSIVSIPLTWGSGETVCLNVARDITEERKLAEQLLHAQRMESIGTLAGGLAHDLNNTLTPILGNAELALRRLDSDSPLVPRLQEIKDGARRAADLVRRILAFSRRQDLHPRTLDANLLIRNLAGMLRRLVEENIELEMDLAATPAVVIADPGQLEQILVNLVVNARDATGGGGTIQIGTRQAAGVGHPCRSCGQPITGEQVAISVADSGSGIPAAIQDRIFEPYFTTKGLNQGTGLGLAMVHGSVHQHGGHLGLASEQGMGTVVTVWLPAAGQPAAPGPFIRPVEPDSLAGGSEVILVVEDHAPLRELVREVLQGYGYRVLAAEDGETALRLYQEQGGAVDLVLSDLVMPGMDGRELVARLRQQEPGLRCLFMSGYTDSRLHGDEAEDADDLLPKPFLPGQLAARVRQALNGQAPGESRGQASH
ncbi:MAG: response regulator [Thermodesulfobacteriota bacterium]